MRSLTFGMNVSLDGYVAAPGDDLGWSAPSDEPLDAWVDLCLVETRTFPGGVVLTRYEAGR